MGVWGHDIPEHHEFVLTRRKQRRGVAKITVKAHMAAGGAFPDDDDNGPIERRGRGRWHPGLALFQDRLKRRDLFHVIHDTEVDGFHDRIASAEYHEPGDDRCQNPGSPGRQAELLAGDRGRVGEH